MFRKLLSRIWQAFWLLPEIPIYERNDLMPSFGSIEEAIAEAASYPRDEIDAAIERCEDQLAMLKYLRKRAAAGGRPSGDGAARALGGDGATNGDRVVRYLERAGASPPSQIADGTGIPTASIQAAIQAALRDARIEKVGRGLYRLAGQGDEED